MTGPRELSGLVGLLGDVHAEDRHLERMLQALEELGASTILCVGDIADGRGDLDRTCALLREHGVICVRGNHDRWALEGTMRTVEDASDPSDAARAFLAALPPTLEFDTPHGKLLLCHGVGGSDMTELRPHTEGPALGVLDQVLAAREDLRFMVGGHTHEAMVRRFSGLWVINAGTLRRGEDRSPSFFVLDLDAMVVERHVLDTALRRFPAERTALDT